MWGERIVRKLLGKDRIPSQSSPVPKPESQCLGYRDQAGRFQFTTFGTELEKERITRELQKTGFHVDGVIDCDRAKRLASMDNR